MKLDRSALDAHPLPPIVNGDKETKGRILIVAGSREVPGAALLAAMGAMRAGAGKLRIATVYTVAPRIGIAMPEAMVVGMPQDGRGGFAERAVERLEEQAGHVDAVVAGPGMAQGEACAAIAKALLAERREARARRRSSACARAAYSRTAQPSDPLASFGRAGVAARLRGGRG